MMGLGELGCGWVLILLVRVGLRWGWVGQLGGGPGEGGMEGRRRLREEKRDGVRERGDCLVLAAASMSQLV